MRIMVRLIARVQMPIALGLFLGLNCSDKGTSAPSDNWWDDVPQVVEIEGRLYDLDAYLYRNFMPSLPPEGGPMGAIIGITVLDSLALPEILDADTMWVLDGNNSWVVELTGDPEPDSLYRFIKRAFDGPKWEPYIYVDVVVRLAYGDRSFMIRESDVFLYVQE